MFATYSGPNDSLPRIRLSLSNDIFAGHVEVIYIGFNEETGQLEVYEPAKIRINVSFGSNDMDISEFEQWIEVFKMASYIARGNIPPWGSDSVFIAYRQVVKSLENLKQPA